MRFISRPRLLLRFILCVVAIGALIQTLIVQFVDIKIRVSLKHRPTRITTSLVETALDDSWRSPHVNNFNERFIKRVELCRSGGPCAPNANKVVILAYGHFRHTLGGKIQGENVWCDAFMDAMYALGYSMIISQTIDELHDLHRKYEKELHMILWSNDDYRGEGRHCLNNSSCTHLDPDTFIRPNATYSRLPAWKIFTLNWWNSVEHPLGAPFTLMSENYAIYPKVYRIQVKARDNQYIGYSLEKTCMKTPYVPHAERPRQAYVFSKRLAFFLEKTNYILPEKNVEDQLRSEFYLDMSKESNITFLGNFQMDVPGPSPPGIVQIPRVRRPEFQAVMARSRVIIGIGRPFLSPTPWECLCLGVPFINPVQHWDRNNPDDESRWMSQQDAILHSGLREPYVYHVKVGDRAGLKRAINKAMETPIPRYIPPQMKMSALIERVNVFMETDWIPIARQQVLKIAAGAGA